MPDWQETRPAPCGTYQGAGGKAYVPDLKRFVSITDVFLLGSLCTDGNTWIPAAKLQFHRWFVPLKNTWETGLCSIHISLCRRWPPQVCIVLRMNQAIGKWFAYILIKGHQQWSLSPPSGLMVLQMPQEYDRAPSVYWCLKSMSEHPEFIVDFQTSPRHLEVRGSSEWSGSTLSVPLSHPAFLPQQKQWKSRLQIFITS